MARLAVGDMDQYRHTSETMLARFSDIEEPRDWYWPAWTCVLAPDAVDGGTYAVIASLGKLAVEAEPESITHRLTYGAVLYRAGRHGEAIEQLTEAEKLAEEPDAASTSSPAYAWYFLAMAYQANGQPEEARKWLGKAVEWNEKVVREETENTGSVSWNRELTLKLLREQAEAMIEPGEEAGSGTEDMPNNQD